MVEYPLFGPLAGTHPAVGDKCPACHVPIAEGDHVTLVGIGPGDDTEQQKRAREHRPYNSVAVVAHYACVTGEYPWEA